MASKYSKQGDKKFQRYKRNKIPKASQGITFPEQLPVPGGMDIAKSTASGAAAGFGVANRLGLGGIPGVGGVAAGVGALVGLGGSLLNRGEIKAENQRIDQMKEAYDDYGQGATDPKLMRRPQMAKDGKAHTDQTLIEIEGKKDGDEMVGELHFGVDPKSKKYILKNVGDNPHSRGGNKVMADLGDVIFDTQGDKEKQSGILALAEMANGGNIEAFMELEKERNKLPTDTKNGKAQSGFQNLDGDPKKTKNQRRRASIDQALGEGPGDDPKELEFNLLFDPDNEDLQNRLSDITGQAFRDAATIAQGDEPTQPTNIDPTAPTTDWGGFMGGSDSLGTDPLGSSLFGNTVGDTELQIGGKTMPVEGTGYAGLSYQDAAAIYGEDNIPKGTYLSSDGQAFDESGQPVSTALQESIFDPYAEAMPRGTFSKQEALDYISEGKHNWNRKNLKKFMDQHGIKYKEAKQYALSKYGDIKDADFGKGRTDKDANVGPMTTKVFSRNYKGVGDPEAASLKTTTPEADMDYLGLPAQPPKETPATPEVTPTTETAITPRRRSRLATNYASDIDAAIDMLEQPERYEARTLDLDRMPFYDMSSPRLRQAEKARAVRAANRRSMVGSRGQQTALAAQDETAAQQAADNIIASEVARHAQTQAQNVQLANAESQFNVQAAQQADQINMGNRAAARNINRLGRSKYVRGIDRDIRTGYMMDRDARLQQRDQLLFNLLGENASPYYRFEGDLYDDAGYMNTDITTSLKPELRTKKTKK